ncbi:MAG: beta-mannosidase, partial [Sphingobacteriaceae bacterium]
MKIYLNNIIHGLACIMLFQTTANAQQVGDFRSNASGNWSNKKITAQSDISGVTGATISQNTYTPGTTWKNATVPATVLVSYINNGTLSNPNTDLNVYNINKSTYNKPYWYRATFTIPAAFSGRTVWLNFDGTNKKADIFLNGVSLGTNLGHMARKKFKFTPVAGTNVIAVMVSPPTFTKGSHDLANLESPTYVVSQGWDWMPQVPGLNSGIIDDVYLSSSTSVTVEDPWIRTALPSPYNNATVNIRVQLKNNTAASVTGNWTGTITPSGQTFAVNNVTIGANGTYDGSTNVTIANPILWWPNGYGGNADGTQQLYKLYTEFKIGATIADSATRAFGVRNVTWNNTSNTEPLKVTVNGQPVFCKGGNWGMSEYLLRSRGAEYDTRVKFHKEMNFNMIRNWTGETTDDEFYDACDKYGVMIFDDFWLNNSGWIQDADTVQFRNNVVEKIKKFRNHPSLVLWCGANEGVP